MSTTCLFCREGNVDCYIPFCEHRFHERCLAEKVDGGWRECPNCQVKCERATVHRLMGVSRHVGWHRVDRSLRTSQRTNDLGEHRDLYRWLRETCDRNLAWYCSSSSTSSTQQKCPWEAQNVWRLDRAIRFVFGKKVMENDEERKESMLMALRELTTKYKSDKRLDDSV